MEQLSQQAFPRQSRSTHRWPAAHTLIAMVNIVHFGEAMHNTIALTNVSVTPIVQQEKPA